MEYLHLYMGSYVDYKTMDPDPKRDAHQRSSK